MDDVSDSNSLTIHFVALLPQNVSGERMRPLTRDEGTKLVARAMAGKAKMYRVDLLQALQRFVGLDHLQHCFHLYLQWGTSIFQNAISTAAA